MGPQSRQPTAILNRRYLGLELQRCLSVIILPSWVLGAEEGVVGPEATSMSKTVSQQRDHQQAPWNKGRLVGQKRPLKPKEVWNIRARLQIEASRRELAMFNLAIDSKLRGCDLVRLKIDDLCVGGRLRSRWPRRSNLVRR